MTNIIQLKVIKIRFFDKISDSIAELHLARTAIVEQFSAGSHAIRAVCLSNILLLRDVVTTSQGNFVNIFGNSPVYDIVS